MSRNALPATLCANLGLSPRDLAEIGGFSERFARDLLSGKQAFPDDVYDALLLIQDDIDVMTDSLIADAEEGADVIWMFRDTAQMRALFPDWPSRGHAAGGFVGPYRIAALTAWSGVREQGFGVDLLFHE